MANKKSFQQDAYRPLWPPVDVSTGGWVYWGVGMSRRVSQVISNPKRDLGPGIPTPTLEGTWDQLYPPPTPEQASDQGYPPLSTSENITFHQFLWWVVKYQMTNCCLVIHDLMRPAAYCKFFCQITLSNDQRPCQPIQFAVLVFHKHRYKVYCLHRRQLTTNTQHFRQVNRSNLIQSFTPK